MAVRNTRIIAIIFIGIVFAFAGSIWLTRVGELADRTTRTIATVDGEVLRFTSIDGDQVVAPLRTNCKLRQKTGRGCAVFYESGDEVLIWYDTQDPTRVWQGSTPGGGKAILLLYSGMTTITAGLVVLFFTSGFAYWLKRLGPAGRRSQGDGGGELRPPR